MLPDFIVIGGMKCGSTSLHHYLDAHPEIGMSEPKELNFFYREERWKNGLVWYSARFPKARIRGESSVNYTKNPEAARVTAKRLRRVNPDAKLIYIVRDPVDRTVSHYCHTRAAGNEARPIDEALSDFGSPYVQRSLFHRNARPLLRRFQTLVLRQEALRDDRTNTVNTIFDFLGVESIDADFSREWLSGDEHPELPAALREQLADYFREDFSRIERLF